MSEVVRFSVSLEGDLLERFDRYRREGRYATRSAAICQLLRERLTEQAGEADDRFVAATLTLVYDHHRPGLAERLLHIQHDHGGLVAATTHVHLDHDTCLEVVILRGQTRALRRVADELRGLKGIHTAHLVMARAEDEPIESPS